jgi:hypothetical protein
MKDLEKERKKGTQLGDELENRRKVQEELMQVIRGEPTDTEYLRPKLSERAIADKERGKAKKRMTDLRGTIASLQERTAVREEELMKDLENERKKVTQLGDELENRRKMQEELMQVIRGEAADTEYLRSKLSEREMRQLAKAQETKRFIDQMMAKSAEEGRLLELQRKTRQETLGRKQANLV